MRVAHVLRKYDPRHWGGTESAVLELLRGLEAQGVESVVYAPRLDEPAGAADPIADLGIEVRRFGAFLPTLGISPEARARSLSVGGNIVSFSAPRMLFFDRKVDLVHSHVLGRLGGAARTVARLRGLPFVVSIHGGYLDIPPNVRDQLEAPTRGGFEYGRAFGALMGARRVVEKADAVITCNPREAELLTRKLPARRVVRMPHGIPTEQFSVDQRASVFDAWPALRDRNLVLCVGRIDAVKNQRFLVERYAALRASLPNTVLVLAGGETDAAYARSLHELVRKEGLDDVVFTGGLAPRDPRLIGLYQAASVFVLPSLTETFGIVVLEAWAAKTPVLTTATSGTRQLVEHGANGFFFDLEDPASFDAPLRQLLTDRNLAHRVAERGERLVREQYDTTQVAGRFKALYEEISARHLP